jgi:hypothetical protein
MCDVDVVGSGIACGLAFAVAGRIQDAVIGPEDKPVRECECSTGTDLADVLTYLSRADTVSRLFAMAEGWLADIMGVC